MNLIIYKVVELEVIHITYGYTVIKLLTGSAVCKLNLTVVNLIAVFINIIADIGKFKTFSDVIFVSTVKYRSHHLPAKCHSGIAEVNFKNLTDVHTRRYAQWVKHDIKRTTVRKEWHILLRKYTGNYTLVTVTTCHLVTGLNLSLLCDINTNNLVYARIKLIVVCSCEYLNINYDTIFTVRHFH